MNTTCMHAACTPSGMILAENKKTTEKWQDLYSNSSGPVDRHSKQSPSPENPLQELRNVKIEAMSSSNELVVFVSPPSGNSEALRRIVEQMHYTSLCKLSCTTKLILVRIITRLHMPHVEHLTSKSESHSEDGRSTYRQHCSHFGDVHDRSLTREGRDRG